MNLKQLTAGISLLILSFCSHAALINTELPESAYITRGGYDIAWISPWSHNNNSADMDLTVQSGFGWSIMTNAIYNEIGGLTAADFAFEGANVDYVTGNNLDEASGARVAAINCCGDPTAPLFDVAVATPWFSNSRTWVDWGQGIIGAWSLLDGDIPISCAESCNETLAYRISAVVDGEVPSPSSIALLGLGFLGLGWARRSAR